MKQVLPLHIALPINLFRSDRKGVVGGVGNIYR